MVDFQKIEREKRLQSREERRERSLVLQRGMSTRVTDQERYPLESSHDRWEEGVEEEASPMEEDLWIELWESLQLEVPQEVRPLSPTNPSTSIQTIVEEDLKLGAGDFGIWSLLDDERNDDNNLLIHQPEEGNWVTLQAIPTNWSIHLLYSTHEGEPPLPNTSLEDTGNLELQTNNCSWTSTREVDPDRLLVGEEMTTKTTN